MQPLDGPYPWYAIQVHRRQEKNVASALLSKGYESFLPLYRCKLRWSDRIKELELPLFSGYLFCRVDITKRLPILVTPGVVRFVGIGKAPVPVDDKEMSAILAIVGAGLRAEPHPYIQVGQRVRIDRGTLAGVEGIVQLAKKPARLIVSVSLLQRSVSVEIDETWVRPLGSADILPRGAEIEVGRPNPLTPPARSQTCVNREIRGCLSQSSAEVRAHFHHAGKV